MLLHLELVTNLDPWEGVGQLDCFVLEVLSLSLTLVSLAHNALSSGEEAHLVSLYSKHLHF